MINLTREEILEWNRVGNLLEKFLLERAKDAVKEFFLIEKTIRESFIIDGERNFLPNSWRHNIYDDIDIDDYYIIENSEIFRIKISSTWSCRGEWDHWDIRLHIDSNKQGEVYAEERENLKEFYTAKVNEEKSKYVEQLKQQLNNTSNIENEIKKYS